MPEMSAHAKAFCTSSPYVLLARRLLLPWALRGARPDGEVLEIGAGSGAMAAALLDRYPAIRLTATDVDGDMVVKTRQRLSSYGERASVRQADATALPFGDGHFDLVLSFAMLHHVGRWEQALAEVVRVLRPGGRLAGYDLVDTKVNRLLHVGEHEGVRMAQPDALHAELARLPVGDMRVRPAFGGFLARFTAVAAPR
jgi:ubiquinone/menaquinone biosynthesis C-methylase UbiE